MKSDHTVHSHANWVLALLFVALAPRAAQAEKIELRSGDVLNGEIVEETEDTIVLEHPELGRVEVPKEQLQPPKPVKRGLLGTSFMQGWDRNASIGIKGQEGVSKELDFNIDSSAKYSDEGGSWALTTAYFYSSNNKSKSDNEAWVYMSRKRFFGGSPWFSFATPRYDFDEFEDWDHRISFYAGVGYHLVRTESVALDARVGPSGNQTFGSADDGFTPEGAIGLHLSWKIAEGHSFDTGHTYFPNFDETGEFRSHSTLNWVISISKALGLSLKLGSIYEYESTNEGDNADLKYFGNLMRSF